MAPPAPLPLQRSVQIPKLNDGIKKFYDQSSGLWEDVWGQHMHHGFYEPGKPAPASREQAQIDMIEKMLEFAGVQSAEHMVDVGCGIGGSSRCVATQCRLQPGAAVR